MDERFIFVNNNPFAQMTVKQPLAATVLSCRVPLLRVYFITRRPRAKPTAARRQTRWKRRKWWIGETVSLHFSPEWRPIFRIEVVILSSALRVACARLARRPEPVRPYNSSCRVQWFYSFNYPYCCCLTRFRRIEGWSSLRKTTRPLVDSLTFCIINFVVTSWYKRVRIKWFRVLLRLMRCVIWKYFVCVVRNKRFKWLHE